MEAIVKVALGVFFGVVLVFVFRVVYINYAMKEATQIITRSAENIQREQRARLKSKQDAIAREERAVAAKLAEDERLLKLERVEAAKNEKAWASYFQDPADCLSYKSEKHMVECANRRIRAKREFEKQWSATR